MAAARNAFKTKIHGVVKGRVLPRTHEGQLLQYGITVPRSVQQELSPAVKCDEEVFVVRMACINKTRKSLACLLYLLTTHRTGNVEEHTKRDRGICVAEKRDLLFLVIVEDRESILSKTHYVTSVNIRDGQSECDKIGLYSNRCAGILLRGRWFGLLC